MGTDMRLHAHTTEQTKRQHEGQMPRLLAGAVEHEWQAHLKVDGDTRNLLGVCLVAVAEMASMGQVQSQDALMWLQNGCVDLPATTTSSQS